MMETILSFGLIIHGLLDQNKLDSIGRFNEQPGLTIDCRNHGEISFNSMTYHEMATDVIQL